MNANQKDNTKTYFAIKHKIKRQKQSNYCPSVHHPDEKINQILNEVGVSSTNPLTTLELFSGQGNLTSVYASFGQVLANEYNKKVFSKLTENVKHLPNVSCLRGDSFLTVYDHLSNKRKFDIIDVDSYGFPNKLFPHLYLLIESGFLFITMPKPYVNILNAMTQVQMISYYGEHNPDLDTIINRLVLWGLCHWRKVELLDTIEFKSVWRLAFRVTKVKATEYTNTVNR